MGRQAHYSPAIDRQIVCALYHEAKHRRKPMTVRVTGTTLQSRLLFDLER